MARYGAVDIGSNSIRMQAAEVAPGEPAVRIAEDREVTRLGESVFEQGVVSAAALDQTTRVLRRMAGALRAAEVVAFRAVATSAVRDARNQDEFLLRAQLALGGVQPEIISGGEEARLIHLGVESDWPEHGEGRLIIDIGGGSAEIIESLAGEVVTAFSKPLGAVRLTQMFFAEDPPSPRSLQQFAEYIREKIAPLARELRRDSTQQVIVTAATAAAVVRALSGLSSADGAEADRLSVETKRVRELFDSLAAKNLRARRAVEGIGPRRAEIVVAGAGVLALILEALGVERCRYSRAGVRDGVIADLAARAALLDRPGLDADQRQSVRRLAVRCGVSPAHAENVGALGARLFTALQPLHGLDSSYGGLLEAAGYLHDVGHFVSDTRHHRHSLYLVANSDLPGFNNSERMFIANLCRYHRKNMPKPSQDNFSQLDSGQRAALLRLIPLLRIADSLDRSQRQVVESIEATIESEHVAVTLQAAGDAALEQWAAEQHKAVFADVYGKDLVVRVAEP